METAITIALILLIVGLAAGYLVRKKKQGVKCIGCPYGASCGRQGKGGCK